MTDTFIEIDGRPALRMERRLAHDPERVWAAITEPDELSVWFASEVVYEQEVGAPMQFVFGDDVDETKDMAEADFHGQVLEFDPPRRFVFSWNQERIEFEVVPDGEGCRLSFTHAFVPPEQATEAAAGWHVCFDALEELLGGTQTTRLPHAVVKERWEAVHPDYIAEAR